MKSLGEIEKIVEYPRLAKLRVVKGYVILTGCVVPHIK